MVEGPKRPTSLNDPDHNPLHIPKHLARRNPHRLEPQLKQPPITPLFPRGSIPTIMRLAIDLDAKPRLQTGEVQRIPFLRALLAKLEPARPLSKLLPQQYLR